jgi:hypothetical protein
MNPAPPVIRIVIEFEPSVFAFESKLIGRDSTYLLQNRENSSRKKGNRSYIEILRESLEQTKSTKSSIRRRVFDLEVEFVCEKFSEKELENQLHEAAGTPPYIF